MDDGGQLHVAAFRNGAGSIALSLSTRIEEKSWDLIFEDDRDEVWFNRQMELQDEAEALQDSDDSDDESHLKEMESVIETSIGGNLSLNLEDENSDGSSCVDSTHSTSRETAPVAPEDEIEVEFPESLEQAFGFKEEKDSEDDWFSDGGASACHSIDHHP